MATKRTTFSESNFSTTNNTSTLTINVYFSADNQVTYFYGETLYCTCNGVTQSKTVSHPAGGSVSTSFTFNNIKHNEDGTKSVSWNWSCATGTSVLGTVTDSGTKTLTRINRYAKTNSVVGSDIESNFSVNYTKYISTYKYKLRISIPGVRALERIDYDTSGETFTLSQETIEDLYTTYTNTNTFNLGFAVESYNASGSTLLSSGNEVIISCKITGNTPIFNDFEFEDINPTTLALTGDSSINVNGYSNVEISISTTNKAEAQKGATMNKYQVRVADMTPVDIAYSDSEEVSTIINNAKNGVYNVYAIDSRNNSTLITKLASQEIAYTPIELNSLNCSVARNDNDIGEFAVLTINGNIWNNNFGQVNNSITNVIIEYKETGSSTWLTSPTTITPTLSGNTFSFTDQVASQEQDYKFDLDKSYNFRITIADELSSSTIDLTPMASGIPNISLADNGVGIMCDYDENLGGYLQVGGEVYRSRNIMNIGLSSNTPSLSNNSTIPFNIISNSVGTDLSFDSSSHGIKIGENISYINVSCLMAIQYSANNGAYSVVIEKNGTEISTMRSWATKDSSNVYSASIPPLLIQVNEDDIITAKFKDGTAIVRPETHLIVEVIK